MRAVAILILLIPSFIAAAPPAQVTCSSAADCRRLALEAIEQQDYETSHTLAWRAVQSGPANDPDLMRLLARAQSLSGRPQDALIMLRRLADRGIAVVEAETHDDFRRVRSLPGWPEVLTRIDAAAGIKREAAEPTAPAAPPPAPSSPAAATPPPAPAPTPPAAKSPATRKEPAASTSKEPAPAKAPVATVSEVLKIPTVLFRPKALDYDVVSRRFIVVEEGADVLKVVDELSANAVNLVSRGWAGLYLPTALAIDRRRGDLWVAGAHESDGMSRAALHHVQLISGRLLNTIELPRESGAARFIDIAMQGDSVLLLDAIGRRVLELEAGTRTLRLYRRLDAMIDPVSLTAGEDGVLYIAHANGILRLPPGAAKLEPIKGAAKVNLTGLQWLREHDGSFVAIQGGADGSRSAVRIRIDRKSGTANSVEVIDRAGSRAASIADGVFYFIGSDLGGGLSPLRRVKLN
jgi:hypothetical protein